MRLRDGRRGGSRAARPRCLRSYTDTAQTMRLLTPELRAGRMRMPKAPGPNQCRGVLRGGRGRGRGSERGRRRERERERELLRERQEHGSGTATRGDSRAAARRGGDGATIPLRRDAVRSDERRCGADRICRPCGVRGVRDRPVACGDAWCHGSAELLDPRDFSAKVHSKLQNNLSIAESITSQDHRVMKKIQFRHRRIT